jgi:TonB-dependent receptor
MRASHSPQPSSIESAFPAYERSVSNKWIRLIGLVACALTALPAQAAEIKGQVYDSVTDYYLDGARVTLKELEKETYADRRGEFNFGNVEPGDYTLITRFPGYSQNIQQVTVLESGEVLSVRVEMFDSSVIELEAFEVNSSEFGQAKALAKQRASDTLVNLVSSDALGQFTDRTAAEALQRVPGVSVQNDQGEGQFVIIRGIDPALNSVSVDGAFSASPEEDGRRTSLSFISIDQLESISVYKTWLPNQWANFIGGSVDLVTRSALDRGGRFASAKLAYGQHTVSDDPSYRGNFNIGDIIEFGDGQQLGLQISLDYSEDNRGSDTLQAAWDNQTDIDLREFPQGFVLAELRGEDYIIRRERQGVSLKAEWSINDEHLFYVSGSFNEFDDDEVQQQSRIATSNSPTDYSGNKVLTTETATQLGYDLNDPAIIQRLNAPTRVEKQLTFGEAVQLGDIAFDEERQIYTKLNLQASAEKRWQNTITNDRIFNYQFGGEHEFPHFSVKHKWFGSSADKDWEERFVLLQTGEVGSTILVGDHFTDIQLIEPATDRIMTPATYKMNENLGRVEFNNYLSKDDRYGGTIDLERTDYINTVELTTSLGVAADYREKSYERDYNRYSEIDTGSFPELNLSDDVFYGGDNLDDFLDSADLKYTFGPYFETDTANAFLRDPGEVNFLQERNDINYGITDAVLRNYEAGEDILAGYLMEEIKWENYQLIFGVRYEQTKNEFTINQILTRDPETNAFIPVSTWKTRIDRGFEDTFLVSETSSRDYDHWLPAVLLRRNFGEDWVVRLAGSQTLVRPRFTDLVPSEVISISGSQFSNAVRLPNFDLAPTKSTNLDLSIEHYFKSFGLISLGVFHKTLIDPIYQETRTYQAGEPVATGLSQKYISSGADATAWRTLRYANTGDGDLMGIEIALERSLDFLPAPFNHFGISANFTLVDSEVELLLEERAGEKVPLFRQSDQLGNFSLYYEDTRFFVRASLVWRGPYLDSITVGRERISQLTEKLELPANAEDIYVDDYLRFDLFASYRVNDAFSIFVEGTNLFDEPERLYYGDGRLLRSLQYTQPVYFVGLKWTL